MFVRKIENYSGDNVTKLDIFDFDGTLFMTPEKKNWESHYNQPWIKNGWWSHLESFDANLKIFTGPAYDKLKNLKADKNTLVIILTARKHYFFDILLNIIKEHKFNVHEIVLKGVEDSDDNCVYKKDIIQKYLSTHTDTEVVEFWDDNLDIVKTIDGLSKTVKTKIVTHWVQ